MKYLCPLFILLFTPSLYTQEQGMASYYGPGFHGKKTASGEIFNQDDFTAAHRSLSFGSQVEVTNLTNGKTVLVKINDRGPFVTGRIIDLSVAAARSIGIDAALGVAKVSLKVISGVRVPEPQEGQTYLQVGAFRTEANAKQSAAKLAGWGYDPKIRLGDLYRVYLGPLEESVSETTAKDLALRGIQAQKRSTPPPGYE